LAVLLGDLNAVAAVVSMFFLTTYGMLNLAAALEAVVQDPSYRPRIRVPWWVSLLGAVGCFVAMFAINPAAFAIAVLIELGIWWYLRRRSLQAAWGDLRTGLWYAIARFAMLQLKGARHDPRNWRPHILVFTADLERNVGLVAMATHFSQDRGIVTVTTLVVGDMDNRQGAYELEIRNRKMLEDAGTMAFVEVINVPDLESGIVSVAQANGIGGLDSNMVAFGWPGDDPDLLIPVIRWVRQMTDIEKSSMWMRPIRGSRKAGRGELLVWWKGKEQNGDLMLLLAHLLSMSDRWRGCRITLCTIVGTEAQAVRHRDVVLDSLNESRISVEIESVVRPDDKTVHEVIRERSQQADLVFMGLARVPAGDERVAAERLIAQVAGLPSTILVRNGSPFKGRLV
jgi:solute carrier family 12 (potassium/chloride transporter), member 4/6